MKIREIKNSISFAVQELNKNHLARNLFIVLMALGFIAALLGTFQTAGIFSHIGLLNSLPNWVGPVVGGSGMLSSIAGSMGLGALLLRGVKHYYDLKNEKKQIQSSDSEDDADLIAAFDALSSSEDEDDNRPPRYGFHRSNTISVESPITNPKKVDFRNLMAESSPWYN